MSVLLSEWSRNINPVDYPRFTFQCLFHWLQAQQVL